MSAPLLNNILVPSFLCTNTVTSLRRSRVKRCPSSSSSSPLPLPAESSCNNNSPQHLTVCEPNLFPSSQPPAPPHHQPGQPVSGQTSSVAPA
eukprot:768392-Hanusia_phi.AAC.6